jgi:hypothetical protein
MSLDHIDVTCLMLGQITAETVALREPGRSWDPTEYNLNHPHVFYPEWTFNVPWLGRRMRLNWGAWRDLVEQQWDIVIVGGYCELTTMV